MRVGLTVLTTTTFHYWTWIKMTVISIGVFTVVRRGLRPLHSYRYHSARSIINDILPGGSLLEPFLISRPVESPNHRRVREYIRQHFVNRLGWQFEEDSFITNTPIGPKRFTNLIVTSGSPATRLPPSHRRIVLACHYDSKRFVEDESGVRQEGFIGATDSAWSCALLLHLAASFRFNDVDHGLQMIFFDGEEPMEEWSDADSIYGAKHLAHQWRTMGKLENIEYMILLDLLGCRGGKLRSFFPTTARPFNQLVAIERILRVQGKLRTREPIFMDDQQLMGVQDGQFTVGDDHIPFAQAGVPILHLIPIPFPDVWHRITDDRTALDPDTCHDIALILREHLCRELDNKI